MDVDGCMEITCFMGVECTDVMAPGVGATCGVCPDGYLGDGDKCEGRCMSTCFADLTVLLILLVVLV